MMSRETRIILLLVIDVLFFFTELIVGYAVGSLALVADSFHMLNDVLSLVVALYAIKLTNQTHIDSRYSYGWHRAEILAALVNGVFLLALCFSIFLEAIERFFSTPEISNPRLIVLVGSLGLASNIVGLFLFHEHGHDHGHNHGKESPSVSKPPSIHSELEDGQVTPRATPAYPISTRTKSRERSASYSSLYGHPAATRASFVQAAQEVARARSPSPSRSRKRSQSRAEHVHGNGVRDESAVDDSSTEERQSLTESTPLLSNDVDSGRSSPHSLHADASHGHDHGRHGGHGHSHGSMNMRALILHVMGDALGNVGVISTGLIIWLTSLSWKYYFDPIISLVITVIIFSSALPLVRSTAFILLQGVPATVSLEETRDAILAVDGVLSVHELHIWQLSENKLVASVHVMASRKHDFMPVAAQIRKVLHDRGVHSSTIQPEYHHPRHSPPEEHLRTSAESSCLIMCPADQICDPSENACCPPPTSDV